MSGRRLGPGGRGSKRDEMRLKYMRAAQATAKSMASLSLSLRDMLKTFADIGIAWYQKRKDLILEVIWWPCPYTGMSVIMTRICAVSAASSSIDPAVREKQNMESGARATTQIPYHRTHHDCMNWIILRSWTSRRSCRSKHVCLTRNMISFT